MWKYFEDNNDEQALQSSRNFIEVNEMKKFFGLIFLMGLNKKPKLRYYWSQNILYKQDAFLSPESLSRDRFLHILRFLRFVDYENLQTNDSLAKVRPFLSIVQHLCKNTYIPEQNVCIDETLLLFKGRFKLRQYVPSKRSRYGIKTYIACESKTGYAFNILSHQFSNELNTILTSVHGADNLMLSQKIVVYLCEHILNQGYHIFIDNYFSSTNLAKFLLENDTLMTGTIRKGRGVPATLVNTNVPPKNFECVTQKR